MSLGERNSESNNSSNGLGSIIPRSFNFINANIEQLIVNLNVKLDIKTAIFLMSIAVLIISFKK